MNRKSTFILLFFTLWSGFCLAQNPISIRSAAMGGVGVGFQDIHSMVTNQAGLAHLPRFGAVASAERRFNLDALNSFTMGAALPTSSGVFGVSLHYFGFEAYNQQKFGLVYARKLFSKLSIGAEVNYHNLSIQEYGNIGLVSFELGVQYDILETVRVGAKIANPVEQELAEGEYLPSRFNLGLQYTPSSKVVIGLEVDKALENAFNVRAGLEYQIIKPLYIRAGVGTNPSLMSVGLGLVLDSGLRIDVTTSYHQFLDWTTGIGIAYQLPTRSE